MRTTLSWASLASGKPADNPFIESFNRSFRAECLNVNRFLSLEDAIEKIEDFKEDYNAVRPHSALCGRVSFPSRAQVQTRVFC
jgi:transposase InsO family protein